MADCAVLTKMNLTAHEVFSHIALNWKLSELGNEERRDRGEVARKNEKLENNLEAARESIARLERVMQRYKTSLCTKRGTAERGSSNGSRRSPKLDDGPEVSSLTRKREMGKWGVCKLCRMVK